MDNLSIRNLGHLILELGREVDSSLFDSLKVRKLIALDNLPLKSMGQFVNNS